MDQKVKTTHDMLAIIFDRQMRAWREYQRIKIENGYRMVPEASLGNLGRRDVQDAIRESMGNLIEELGEARNKLKAKPWKRTYSLTNVEDYNEELADAVHFFVELLILSGWSAEDVFRHYFKKADVNQTRRDGDY